MSEQIAPNDDAIITEYIAVEEGGTFTVIWVGTVQWSSQTPSTEWVVAEEIQGTPRAESISLAVHRILNSRRFFAICQECGERIPQGCMHDDDICQGCAEKNHGVVH